jgi:uncharacterized protein (DUF362 family)
MNRREAMKRGLRVAGAIGGAALLTPCGRSAKAVPARESLATRAPTAPVAIERCMTFGPQEVRKTYDAAFDRIGGIKKIVENKTVTVKINMTGMSWNPVFDLPAYETYQTHPNTVAALCAALHDAGARRIVVVENYYWRRSPEEILGDLGWDIAAVKSAGGHKVLFEDTRNLGKFKNYARFMVPWGGYVFPGFEVNALYEKTDVLISLAKLKQHARAGVTGAVKNFFGNTPSSLYGDDGPGEDAVKHRAAMFHSGRGRPPAGVPQEIDHDIPATGQFRVPNITADIFGARPSDLNIVEGIRSISGGEGHWNRGIGLVEPKLVLVGRNGVCTDAVCTAVMGFDPQAASEQFPFQGDNHLQLLADGGIGTNDLERIEVAGLTVKEALYPYAPERMQSQE